VPKNPSHHRLIILGSGPAGYTAAIYAARANLSPTIITGMAKGGQLMITTDVDNWPGDAQGVQGPDLMDRMEQHAKRFGTKIIFDSIKSVNFLSRPLFLQGESYAYTADSVILSTGARAKYLGLPSETAFIGKGVSACATCDGFFYKDQPVAVVGGGNTAVEEALYLSDIASHITLIHRRDSFRAEPILSDRLLNLAKKTGKITIEWFHVLEEVLGNQSKGVFGAKIKQVKTQATKTIDVNGIFIAIGHSPNTSIFENQLAMKDGYILVKNDANGDATQTNIPGVFAAGDVADRIYRQAVTSASSGCMAALDVKKYLDNLK